VFLGDRNAPPDRLRACVPGEGRVPVFRDILDTTVPLGMYIGARLREGKLPQWYPYEGLGEPFIGQLNESAFHPASWLFAILPGPSALRWDLLLGYLAAGFGQLLLARRLGMSLTASALAAVVFAFSGYAISLSNLLPYLWGMASLPWLGLFAAEVATRDRPWPWVAALALCWASIVVAGDSHSALLGALPPPASTTCAESRAGRSRSRSRRSEPPASRPRWSCRRTLPLRIWPQLAAAPLHVPRLHGAWHAALLATGAALAASAAILVGARFRPAAIALLPLAVFLELWVANGATIGVAPASVLLDTPRLCNSARQAGAGPDGLRVVSASSRSRQADELERAGIWAAMSRNLLQPDSSALCGIGSVWGWPILSNEPRVLREVIGRGERHPVLQLYGFGLLVRAFPEDRPVPDEVVVDAVSLLGKGLVLVKRPAAPRAYAAMPRWVPDAAAARGEVERRGLSLVEAPVLVGVGEPFTGGAGPVGTVRIAAYEPEHVALEARMERAGAVILNDLDASGWTATVDGTRARIYNANALVRGVLVPPGAHRIEMRYALPGLREGLVVSGASLLLCAGLALAGRGRRKRVPAVS
jgi:hypothetical protein